MKIYNTAPYFDDYNDDKRFHQVLYKPGVAVQARELNQMQTIAQYQVKKFGDHIFKNGSIVIPGNSVSDLSTPYCKINLVYNTDQLQASQFEGMVISGTLTGIEARVRKAVQGTSDITLYLNYIKGSGANTANVFLDGEEIFLKDVPTVRANLLDTNATGVGSLAFINRGVYYVNGTFVNVLPQSVVMSENTSTPSCRVLLKIVEEVISANEDPSLYDNANGSDNFAAPGADRARITLQLTTLPLDSQIDDSYVEIMRYNNGVLEEHAKNPRYSELEKSLARRTYDESGNYLVEGFQHTLRDHLRTPYNNGVSPDGDRDKFVVEIAPGRGYIQGLETESISTKRLILDKARTEDHIKLRSTNIKSDYGRYVYVTEIKTLPNFRTRQTVDLYNTNDPLDVAGTKIGTMDVIAIDYHTGDAESDTAIYKLYVDNLSIDAPNTISSIGGIRFGSGGSAVVLTKYRTPNAAKDFTAGEIVSNATGTRTATVVRYNRPSGEMFVERHDKTKPVPVSGDLITGDSLDAPTVTIVGQENLGGNSNPPIFDVPASPLASIKNILGTYDIQYTVWKSFTVTTDATGYAQYTMADGTIVPVEAGTITAVTDAGIVTRDKISVINNNQLTITGATPNSTVWVICQVIKTGITPKQKTLVTQTLTNVVPASIISLTKADIVRVIQVTSNGADVTSRFTLDDGQTDYYYGLGRLILTGQMPTNNLNITFEYYEHSGSGDYFSIDSYSSIGEDYIALAPTYRSITSGRDYDLGNCLDFRPRVGSTGTFETGSPGLVDHPVIDTFITTSAKYFVPRIDVVALSKGGVVTVLRGTPRDEPRPQQAPEDMIGLVMVYIDAYTTSLSDVTAWSLQKYRYTMTDISRLEKRLQGVEEMSLLNTLESSVIDLDVIDPVTGLSKFRSAYLVDNFTGYNVCDYFNEQNISSIYRGELTSVQDTSEIRFDLLEDSANYQNTGGQITLPYTEVPFISQDLSTRVTNLNPFMVVNYSGVMVLNPSFDTWVELRNLDTILKTENKSVVVERVVNRPCPPAVSYDDGGGGWSPAPTPAPSKPSYSGARPDVEAAYNAYGKNDYDSLAAFNYAHLQQYGEKEGMVGKYSSYW